MKGHYNDLKKSVSMKVAIPSTRLKKGENALEDENKATIQLFNEITGYRWYPAVRDNEYPSKIWGKIQILYSPDRIR